MNVDHLLNNFNSKFDLINHIIMKYIDSLMETNNYEINICFTNSCKY